MEDSIDTEDSYWNNTVSEPVNIHEGVVSPKGCATGSEEQKEVSETEDGLNDVENSPGILPSPHEPMDVDMPGTVAESWADSMDDIGTDPSEFQSHTYDRDNTTAERQDNAYEDHMPRQYIQESRDSWRSRGSRVYQYRWSQSRASSWQGSRGRGFGGWEPRDRCFRSRGFRSWELQQQVNFKFGLPRLRAVSNKFETFRGMVGWRSRPNSRTPLCAPRGESLRTIHAQNTLSAALLEGDDPLGGRLLKLCLVIVLLP